MLDGGRGHGPEGHEGQAAVDVETKMEDFAMSAAKVEPWKAGALGGAVSGALGSIGRKKLISDLSSPTTPPTQHARSRA